MSIAFHRHVLLCAGFGAMLGGCALGPNYKRPALEMPAQFKELQGWKEAEPGTVDARSLTWSIYSDPALDDLEKQVVISNQNIKAAEAAYRQARAALGQARAGFFPTISAGFSGQRAKGSGNTNISTAGTSAASGARRNLYDLSGDVSWDLDIWGRTRRNVESGVANAKASQADLAGAQLSAQAALASSYISLRFADEQARVLQSLIDAQSRALEIARNRYKAGIAGKADVLSAQTQLESTQAQAVNIASTRAKLEHAIAILVGKAPADFALEPAPFTLSVPQIPPGLPSGLLERRPDVAGAERRMQSANAEIGVAWAAFFPSVTLSGSGDYVSSALSTLFAASNPAWSIGANAAETLFNGGARIAQLNSARAAYDENVANYRQTVLTAFQEVEDNLSTGRILTRQAEIEESRVNDAREAERITLNEYKAGTADFTTVITAQTQRFNAEIERLSIFQDRLTASVSLIQALGGGWSTAQIAKQ
jgi:NodT family efflux transporter outer membrane factor (OMF) lipoprotein